MGRLFARAYDHVVGAADRRWLGAHRARLVGGARGEVLEVGAGTGLNSEHYRGDVALRMVEPDAAMRRRLRARLAVGGPAADVRAASAANLPFDDDSFDSVVVTLVLCSVPDQRAALREMHRVLRPSGRLLVLEHVRAPDGMSRWQDRLDRIWPHVAHGCHPNRDTEAVIEAAGFAVVSREGIGPPGWAGRLAPHVTAVYRPVDLAA